MPRVWARRCDQLRRTPPSPRRALALRESPMTSFIEVPAFFGDAGEELGSDYVNVDSIVVMRPDFGGEHTMIQTHGTTRVSYLPIDAFIAALDELAHTPGVHT